VVNLVNRSVKYGKNALKIQNLNILTLVTKNIAQTAIWYLPRLPATEKAPSASMKIMYQQTLYKLQL